ncbi:MAG: hypothetical protein ABFC84_11955 [Veillonellales bacterium]
MLDVIINYAYIIFVPIIAIAGTVWYMNSHTFISTGPEGEAKGCLGVFITFGIVGAILVTLAMYALAWGVQFFLAHWKWVAGAAVVLVVLLLFGNQRSNPTAEKAEGKR